LKTNEVSITVRHITINICHSMLHVSVQRNITTHYTCSTQLYAVHLNKHM